MTLTQKEKKRVLDRRKRVQKVLKVAREQNLELLGLYDPILTDERAEDEVKAEHIGKNYEKVFGIPVATHTNLLVLADEIQSEHSAKK